MKMFLASNNLTGVFLFKRKAVDNEITRLLKLDIIEPAAGEPTPWISPIHAVPKPKQPGEIRLVVDMRAPNKAILRERHITPTTDDLVSLLANSRVFSTIDLNSGYHQLQLNKKSRYITTFSTHIGLFRYKRLNFGINSAAEVFQNTIHDILSDIPGVLNVSDDILVHAKTPEEHDVRLRLVLQRLKDKNLTINEKKCKFAKSSIEFFGNIFSDKGISPDPHKVDEITNFKTPQNAKELQSAWYVDMWSIHSKPFSNQ